jgi:hypothetical protein
MLQQGHHPDPYVCEQRAHQLQSLACEVQQLHSNCLVTAAGSNHHDATAQTHSMPVWMTHERQGPQSRRFRVGMQYTKAPCRRAAHESAQPSGDGHTSGGLQPKQRASSATRTASQPD